MSNDEVIRDFRVAPIIRRAAQLSVLLSMFVASASAQRAPNVVIQWNQAALQGVRDGTLGPPMVARALAIVHTCMYDAWAAYDRKATGTQLGGSLRTLPAVRTPANKRKAISFAAYRAAVELFAWDKATVFDPLMAKLGYDVDDTSTDTRTPAGIGNVACAAVLAFRHTDGSNQLGDLTASGIPYADYTGYQPKNLPSTVPVSDLSTVLDPNRWQPLPYFNGTKVVTPTFVGAQWYKVTPFAMISPDQFLPFVSLYGPALYGSPEYTRQAQELVDLSAHLTDKQKMIAEYWANGPHSELPPGHWDLFAQYVSARDHHTLDEDVKIFFCTDERNFRRRHRCLGRKARLRFCASRHCNPLSLPWPTNSMLGRPGTGHYHNRWRTLGSISTGYISHTSFSGIYLRSQHVQCGGRHHPGAVDRQRTLRSFRYFRPGEFCDRAWHYA